MINITHNTANKDAFLIEKLKLDLIRDIENYLEFDDLTEEERSEICEEIAMNEYDGNNYDYDVYDEAIFELASEKMGFIRPTDASNKIDYKEEEGALQYNLSYSQEKYAREQWIEDLKESLQGEIYNRADKIFIYNETKTVFLNNYKN